MPFVCCFFFFFKQKTAYEFGLGIPAEPLFRSRHSTLFRYTQDAFSRSGWLWPVDAKGERSEERRVGKECRCGGGEDKEKKNKKGTRGGGREGENACR